MFPWEHKPIIFIDEKPEPVDAPIGSLNIDATYQALVPRNPRLIREIGRHFDLTLFGRLRVVRRATGALFIVDGRHRWEGAKAAGRLFVPCDIYDVHSRQREIEIFLACNTRLRKVPQGMLFMAEVASGDAEAVALNRLVQDAGLAIVDANSQKQEFAVPKIACIAALKSLYGHGSPSYAKRATPVRPEELNAALGMIADLAPPNALVTEHATLGFVWLIHNYPALRDHAKRLADLGWRRLDMAARAVGPRPKAEDAGKALLSVIDFRRPASARLAPELDLPAPPDWLPPMAKAA
ncbi:MAG: DUF6551 family protein [Planctomycetota bacterium]